MKSQDAKELLKDIGTLDDGVAQSCKLRDRLFQMLVECVKYGDSTGDNIRDFAIVHFHEISGEREKRLREIDNLISEHKGKLLLVAWYEEREGLVVKHASDNAKPKSVMGPVFGGGRYPVCFWLGEIIGDHLRLNMADGIISFPVTEFAVWTGDNKPIARNSSGPDKEVLALLLDTSHSLPFLLDTVFGRHRQATAELHIGTEEVLACLNREANGEVLFYKMAHAVGYPEEKMPQDIVACVATVKGGVRAQLAVERAAILHILGATKRIGIGRDVISALSNSDFQEITARNKNISRLLAIAKELGMGEDSLVIEFLEEQEVVKKQMEKTA